MKILFVVNNPHTLTNPYVKTLIDGLKALENKWIIDWGCNKFWLDEVLQYDILHIQWPDHLLQNGKYSAKDLEKRMAKLKSMKIKIVSTCHNLIPHTHKTQGRVLSYNIIYSYSDIIIHLGKYSKELLQRYYTKANHLLIPHHVYDTIYDKEVEKSEALKYLKLSPKNKYILCFGIFRNNIERRMVTTLSKIFSKEGVKVLAPSFARIPSRRNPLILLPAFLKYLYYKILYPDIYTVRTKIPDEEVPFYYACADICFIQRIDILNSGNLPLALYMGNIVVGPDKGNVGTILKETGNFVFNPNDKLSIANSVRAALNETPDKGLKNREWASLHLSTNAICLELRKLYINLLNGK